MKQLSMLMIAVCLFTAITPTKAQVNTQDSLALVDLYDSTGGANWTIHTNWLTSAPVSSWYGITVSGGRVTEIGSNGTTNFFLNNNLSGSIPSSIGNLSNLQVLYLKLNNLSGVVPSAIGNLNNLQNLDLSANLLRGAIPSSLGNLTSLQYLHLDANFFTDTLPSSLGNLHNLIGLFLYSNIHLSRGFIPSSFGNLVNL